MLKDLLEGNRTAKSPLSSKMLTKLHDIVGATKQVLERRAAASKSLQECEIALTELNGSATAIAAILVELELEASEPAKEPSP